MLTPYGEAWVEERFKEVLKEGRYSVEEFWIRAFCNALDNMPEDDFRERFNNLKRKLLKEVEQNDSTSNRPRRD